jgi:hypothetical protein
MNYFYVPISGLPLFTAAVISAVGCKSRQPYRFLIKGIWSLLPLENARVYVVERFQRIVSQVGDTNSREVRLQPLFRGGSGTKSSILSSSSGRAGVACRKLHP